VAFKALTAAASAAPCIARRVRSQVLISVAAAPKPDHDRQGDRHRRGHPSRPVFVEMANIAINATPS